MSTTATLQPLSGTYVADVLHSSFGFALRYMGVSTFRGTLDDVSATLTAGPDGVALQGAAKVASIATRMPEQFHQHVLSAEFFDAANHPEVSFRSTKAELAADGRATVEGELTIKGTTLPVRAEGSWAPEAETFTGRRAHLSLVATIDRTAFGVGPEQALPNGEPALANKITLEIELALIVPEQDA